MLVYGSKLLDTPILSLQTGTPIGYVSKIIINPDNLKVIAFNVDGSLSTNSGMNTLDISSIREYSTYGFVVDSEEELVAEDDIIRISEVLKLNFDLVGLRVETKKGSKLGKITDYTLTSDDFTVQQLIVKRPAIKSIIDPELTISRQEIVEITDYKIVIKDEEKTIKKKAEEEEFVPNFVNPFRSHEQDFAPIDNQNLADKDIE
ncbi:hypothetical protein IJG89_01970 [Candidatus Saccharibacteria bacterium]|nr:hypothetical protein [Candidatus Saccharibacteria bacterium]